MLSETMLVKYRAIENGFVSSFVFWCDCTISFILEMHFSTDSLNVSRKGSFVTELNSMALLSDFLLQPEFKSMSTFGVQISEASEARVSVIVTTTAEDREVVFPLPCERRMAIVG